MTTLWTSASPLDNTQAPTQVSTPLTMRTVLVCDVVESMLWMQAGEAAAVAQWQAFVAEVKRSVLPRYGARLVKSLGDGLMLEFDLHTHPEATPRAAVQAAHTLHRVAQDVQLTASKNLTPANFHPFQLRIGLHHTPVTVGEDDIYGHGVNLCARIAGLAGPGETIISSDMRDQLTDQIDADIEDMGECYLKHVDAPVRVYRAGKASSQPILVPVREYNTPLQATIAVIPFVARSLAADNQLAVGEIIADGVIGQLSRTRDLKVISRLSTSVFRNQILSGNAHSVSQIEGQLGANYILSGSYIAQDKKLIVTAELAETKSNQVVWMDRIAGDIGDILQLQSELCNTIANAAHMAILDTEVQAALNKPLPTLESYSLLLAGITMMHRSTPRNFDASKDMLEILIERHRDSITSSAWLAKWYVMRIVRGFSVAAAQDANQAIAQTKQILNTEPSCALALAIQGHALCQFKDEPEQAVERLDQALLIDPNEPLAWLYRSVWSTMWGDVDVSVIEAKAASDLSPIDPMRYHFDTILAASYAANSQWEEAIAAAKRAHRANKHHAPTLRTLLVAQVENGRMDEAQETLSLLRLVMPNLTIKNYLKLGSNTSYTRMHFMKILRILKVSEN